MKAHDSTSRGIVKSVCLSLNPKPFSKSVCLSAQCCKASSPMKIITCIFLTRKRIRQSGVVKLKDIVFVWFLEIFHISANANVTRGTNFPLIISLVKSEKNGPWTKNFWITYHEFYCMVQQRMQCWWPQVELGPDYRQNSLFKSIFIFFLIFYNTGLSIPWQRKRASVSKFTSLS